MLRPTRGAAALLLLLLAAGARTAAACTGGPPRFMHDDSEGSCRPPAYSGDAASCLLPFCAANPDAAMCASSGDCTNTPGFDPTVRGGRRCWADDRGGRFQRRYEGCPQGSQDAEGHCITECTTASVSCEYCNEERPEQFGACVSCAYGDAPGFSWPGPGYHQSAGANSSRYYSNGTLRGADDPDPCRCWADEGSDPGRCWADDGSDPCADGWKGVVCNYIGPDPNSTSDLPPELHPACPCTCLHSCLHT